MTQTHLAYCNRLVTQSAILYYSNITKSATSIRLLTKITFRGKNKVNVNVYNVDINTAVSQSGFERDAAVPTMILIYGALILLFYMVLI